MYWNSWYFEKNSRVLGSQRSLSHYCQVTLPLVHLVKHSCPGKFHHQMHWNDRRFYVKSRLNEIISGIWNIELPGLIPDIKDETIPERNGQVVFQKRQDETQSFNLWILLTFL